MNIQTTPLIAVTVAVGWDENSSSTPRHASAVQTLSAFQDVMDNTSHSRRVTRRGVFFIGQSQSLKREQAKGPFFEPLPGMAYYLKAESKLVWWENSFA